MLTLKNDLAFRIFFSKKGNEKFLKDFLESILEMVKLLDRNKVVYLICKEVDYGVSWKR